MPVTLDDLIKMEERRPFVCGTRRVERITVGDYRVVCATCGGGGTVRHDNREKACSAAVRDSNKACRKCGAR
jgi:hypothetical protein